MPSHKSYTYYIPIILFLTIIFGCNGGNDLSSDTTTTGPLSLKIKWEPTGSDHSENVAGHLDCNKSGVETIEIIIYDANGSEIVREKPWECSDHKGTIKDIPKQKISILLLAKDTMGDVVFRGMKNNVEVHQGKTNQVSITASPFIPELLSPKQKSCATYPILTWETVSGAKTYHGLISDNKEMENATPFMENQESHQLINQKEGSMIFWMVYAEDAYGNISQASEVYSFSSNKTLLKDICPATDSSFPSRFAEINKELYFVAEATIQNRNVGRELCVTNYTTPGTEVLKDLNKNQKGSNISNLIELNGDLIFIAEDTKNGVELWAVKLGSGKKEPELLKDIFPGPSSSMGSRPDSLIKFKDKIYFSATNGVNGSKLWRSDGTKAGTVMVQNITPNEQGPNYPGGFTLVPGKSAKDKDYLFFCASHKINGDTLWKTDGTSEGTLMIKDLNPNGLNTTFSCFTALNGILYFQSNDGVHGRELWISDGTEKGTMMIKDTNPDGHGNPLHLIICNNKLFFFSNKGIWESDGTKNGTTLIKEVQLELPQHLPYGVNSSCYQNQLYFNAMDDNSGSELWVSDGTSDGTYRFKDINKNQDGRASSHPQSFTVINNFLYFNADDGINGRELWRSDGTAERTAMVKDIWEGPNSGTPDHFIEIGTTGNYIFSANDGFHGDEIWISEGGDKDIRMLKDINKIKSDNPPKHLTILNDSLYFAAEDENKGIELWKSDFTKNGTQLVEDIDLLHSSSPRHLTVLDDTLYFFAKMGDKNGLWQSRGDKENTTLIHTLERLKNGLWPSKIMAFNNYLFFIMDGEIHGEEVWVSDLSKNTLHSINIAPLTKGSSPRSLTHLGDKLFFIGSDDPAKGKTLYFTNGNQNNINKTETYSKIGDLVPIGNQLLYYFANDDVSNGLRVLRPKKNNGYEISLVEKIRGRSLKYSGNQLFYLSNESGVQSLWRMDGYSQKRTKIILPNGPNFIRRMGNFIPSEIGHYFITESGEKAYDLWLTDGTSGGTRLILKNIQTSESALSDKMIAFKQCLFFKANDIDHGYELWMTDGTERGTKMIWDIYQGSESGNPQELTLHNNTLYFTAFDDTTGGEIRSFCLDSISPAIKE